MGLTFYNPEKNTYADYVVGKVKRLLIPMLMACLILLVPRLYLSQEYEPWTRIDDVIETNYFVYMWKVLPSLYSKLSWLWFLGVLFLAFILNYPMLAFSHRRKKGIQFDIRADGKIIMGQIATLSIWSIPCMTLVSENDAFNYLVPSIAVLGLFYTIMFGLQLFIQNPEYGYKIAIWSKLVGPICCIFMNNFKYGSYENNLYGLLLGLHYQSIFLAQGMFDTFYNTECLKYRSELSKTIMTPLFIGGFYVLLSFTSPMNHSDTGFLFYYPIYF